jgi:hypothetical protein
VRALPCRSEWLVGRGGAEVQGADQGVAGEDCDPDAVLEHGDGQLLVAAAEVDAQLGSDRARRSADGDARAGADAATVGLDLAGQWPVGMRALTLAANTAAGGAAAQGAVRASGVVVLGEHGQVAVQSALRPVGPSLLSRAFSHFFSVARTSRSSRRSAGDTGSRRSTGTRGLRPMRFPARGICRRMRCHRGEMCEGRAEPDPDLQGAMQL